jgi:hypothetical protein
MRSIDRFGVPRSRSAVSSAATRTYVARERRCNTAAYASFSFSPTERRIGKTSRIAQTPLSKRVATFLSSHAPRSLFRGSRVSGCPPSQLERLPPASTSSWQESRADEVGRFTLSGLISGAHHRDRRCPRRLRRVPSEARLQHARAASPSVFGSRLALSRPSVSRRRALPRESGSRRSRREGARPHLSHRRSEPFVRCNRRRPAVS